MKKTLALFVAGLLAITWLGSAQAKTYIRYEAHTVGGQKALASMQKAMKILKERGCKDPVSWYYQGAMHWSPDVSAGDNLVNNPLCPSFNKANPQLSTAWNTCASHNSTGPSSGIHFLPWHRMFLVYLEKIIREVSQDPDFALPYWNYGRQYMMPQLFQASAGGSLYEKSRRISLNAGSPIEADGQATIASDLRQLSQIRDYDTFNNQLNNGLHGYMHDYIGGTNGLFNPIYNSVVTKDINPGCVDCGMMAIIPSAGFDPIFWLHHSNVDRLWQNFIIANPTNNITLAQLNSVTWPYNFFQIIKKPADFGSTLVELTMPEVLKDINTIDYRFDDQVQLKMAVAEKTKTVPLQENTLFSAEPNAKATHKTSAKLKISLPKKLKVLVPESDKTRVILELTVSYKGTPRGRYEVFVGLPEGIAADSKTADEKYYVGAISFFVHDPQGKGGARTFRYDITDELFVDNVDIKDFDVSIIKAYGPEESIITINNAVVKILN